MKKFVLACATVVLLGSFNASADNVGCGLGAVAMKGNTGLGYELIATFLNALSGNQTFGMSTGTSGCQKNQVITGGSGKVFAFLNNNMEQFAIDAARGEGETIVAIAEIVGVPAKQVGETAKANFSMLFAENDVDAAVVSERLVSLF